MTQKALVGKKKGMLYDCPVCGFFYKEQKWAQACERYCTEHKSCSLEITRHAVQGG